jgi:hypothetical protein
LRPPVTGHDEDRGNLPSFGKGLGEDEVECDADPIAHGNVERSYRHPLELDGALVSALSEREAGSGVLLDGRRTSDSHGREAEDPRLPWHGGIFDEVGSSMPLIETGGS